MICMSLSTALHISHTVRDPIETAVSGSISLPVLPLHRTLRSISTVQFTSLSFFPKDFHNNPVLRLTPKMQQLIQETFFVAFFFFSLKLSELF